MSGVWASPAAREEFSPGERIAGVVVYERAGPQLFAGGGGFAYCSFGDARTMVLADNDGKVSLFALEEVQEEQRRIGLA